MLNDVFSKYLPDYSNWAGNPMANYGRGLPDNALTGGFDMSALPEGASGFNVGNFGNWGGIPAVTPDRGIMSSFLQQKYADGSTGGGYGSVGLGVLQGLGSAYMGMKQYSLAKDSLKQSKEQFNRNYDAQKTTTNASLEDRQAARVASNPSGYQSVGDYMNKNRIV